MGVDKRHGVGYVSSLSGYISFLTLSPTQRDRDPGLPFSPLPPRFEVLESIWNDDKSAWNRPYTIAEGVMCDAKDKVQTSFPGFVSTLRFTRKHEE